ncbi:MAG: hypothetical protein JNK82_39150 [Myxococcaceae bacterium]|nr:hypothetical protein [Myxococcaceae bacterium]
MSFALAALLLGVAAPCAVETSRPSLVEALEVELGALAKVGACTVRVVWPEQADGAAALTLVGAGGTLSWSVELAGVEPHLRDRTVALAVRQLMTNAPAVALAPAPAAVPAPPPRLEPERAWSLRASARGRVFFYGPNVTGGAEVGWAWRWLRASALAEGTRRVAEEARIDGFIGALAVEALPLRFQRGVFSVSGGAFVEGGLAATFTTPRLDGFAGTTALAPLGGAGASVELVIARFLLSARLGFDVGTRVLLLGTPALYLHGPFASLSAGLVL